MRSSLYIHTGLCEHTEKELLLGQLLFLSAQDHLGIQWIKYRDRKLNLCSYETPASRSMALLTTVLNCWLYNGFINKALYKYSVFFSIQGPIKMSIHVILCRKNLHFKILDNRQYVNKTQVWDLGYVLSPLLAKEIYKLYTNIYKLYSIDYIIPRMD